MAKTVLITGGAKGIGAAAAEAFAKRGYNIAINYRASVAAAKKTLERVFSYGVRAQIYACDVSDFNACEKLFKKIDADFGEIDVLVNNAGISEYELLIDMTREGFDKMLAVNVGSVFDCSKSAIERMLKKGGAIVNVASIWGLRGQAAESHYSASKAAIISLTQSLAKEYGSAGIRINAVAAGAVDTDMLAGFTKEEIDEIVGKTPLSRLGQPSDVAEAIFFLASDAASFITGHTLVVDGGLLL